MPRVPDTRGIFKQYQALEGLKFQALEGLKFQNNQTQKQMNRTIVFSHHQAFSFQTDLKSLLSLFPTFKYHLNSQEMYNKGEVVCNLVEVQMISVGEFIELICKIFVFPFDLICT